MICKGPMDIWFFKIIANNESKDVIPVALKLLLEEHTHMTSQSWDGR